MAKVVMEAFPHTAKMAFDTAPSKMAEERKQMALEVLEASGV